MSNSKVQPSGTSTSSDNVLALEKTVTDSPDERHQARGHDDELEQGWPPNVNGKPIRFTPSVGSGLGSPTALAIGAFATTLTTLSFALMGWRNITVDNVFIGNFFFVAGIGMVVSAQWELVRGNSYGYTVLSAFGLFYAGFGAIITPYFGVAASYPNGTKDVQYNNALGFWVLMWTVFNTFFLIGSFVINLVYIGIFLFVELAFGLIAASYFATADGHATAANNLKIAGGVFAFLAGLLGYYTVGHLMCQQALFFSFPMGETSGYFEKRLLNEQRPPPQHERTHDDL